MQANLRTDQWMQIAGHQTPAIDIAKVRLPPSERFVLMELRTSGPMSAAKLADELEYSYPHMIRALEHLVKIGVVKKKKSGAGKPDIFERV